jgi:hypothetical protein
MAKLHQPDPMGIRKELVEARPVEIILHPLFISSYDVLVGHPITQNRLVFSTMV